MGGEGIREPLMDWTDFSSGEEIPANQATEVEGVPEGMDCRFFPNPSCSQHSEVQQQGALGEPEVHASQPMDVHDQEAQPSHVQEAEQVTEEDVDELARHQSFMDMKYSRMPGLGGDMSDEERAEHDKLKQLLLQKRQSLAKQAEHLETFREKIVRYKPGEELSPVGGRTANDYKIPEATSLLLVGHMGAGKSTLINNMIRVVNKKKHGFDRAQVLAQQGENGTFLLEEYNVCEESGKILAFDSRGLPAIDTEEGQAIIQHWIVNGIRHGQKVIRPSDSTGEKENLEARARHGHHILAQKRDVNFVLFVVSAVSLHTMLKRHDQMAIKNLSRLCKSPFLSFKDDRPVVVMTHGDQLTLDDRIDARILLGKILGVSPVDYIFDVAGYTGRKVEEDDETSATEDLALLEMLEFALHRADRNLPYKADPLCTFVYQIAEDVSSVFQMSFRVWHGMDGGRKVIAAVICFSWVVCAIAFLAFFIHLKAQHRRQDYRYHRNGHGDWL